LDIYNSDDEPTIQKTLSEIGLQPFLDHIKVEKESYTSKVTIYIDWWLKEQLNFNQQYMLL
jgi:hypothetical protein